MINPFLDDNGFDVVTQTLHCALCEAPVLVRQVVVKDYLACHWQHYGYIYYPEIVAKDEKSGKTIEGAIVKPARTVMALLPEQSALSFCLDCAPQWDGSNCPICKESINPTFPYTRVETLIKQVDGINKSFRIFYLHHECLPSQFEKVKSYHQKYGPEQNG